METADLEDRLERGEVVVFEQCPFPLPEAEDRAFLLDQTVAGGAKSISYYPDRRRAHGFRQGGEADAEISPPTGRLSFASSST